MATINLSRLLIGGLVAGLVINIGEFILNGVLLASAFDAFRAELGLAAPSAAQLGASSVIMFAYGIALVWIYVSIRPRFGAGPKTAVIAGLTFWFIAYVLFTASMLASGLLTAQLTLFSILWGVFEAPIAAITGASLYREGDDGA